MKLLRLVNRITPPFIWDAAKKVVKKQDEAPLPPFVSAELRSHSQYGEDLVIDALLGCPEEGFYVDIGANDPDELSNTRRFYDRGWRGINVEPNTDLWSRFKESRPRDVNLNIGIAPESGSLEFYRIDPPTLSTFDHDSVADNLKHPGARLADTVEVNVEPLHSVLASHAVGQRIDFLSVDTEGFDMAVLASNDWSRFRPALVLVEVTWRGQELVDFLEARGYRYLWSNGLNALLGDRDDSRWRF